MGEVSMSMLIVLVLGLISSTIVVELSYNPRSENKILKWWRRK